ncbi:MAG: TlpA family protein disulfide reductase [Planctomycetes bacterium]|nr:TlpA family protein disulfide reductase [Planctomycetota bacterium]
MSDPVRDPSRGARRRAARGALVPLAALAVCYALYAGVTAAVRTHVDHRIDAPVGRPVLDFELPDTTGHAWRAADLRGRYVVLNFFRSQCASCLAERDAVRQLAARVDPAQVEVLGVFLDAVQGYDPAVSAATLRTLAYRHPVLIADAAFVDAFHGAGWAHVTPVTYVVGPDGSITGSHRGVGSYAELAALLPADALRR